VCFVVKSLNDFRGKCDLKIQSLNVQSYWNWPLFGPVPLQASIMTYSEIIYCCLQVLTAQCVGSFVHIYLPVRY